MKTGSSLCSYKKGKRSREVYRQIQKAAAVAPPSLGPYASDSMDQKPNFCFCTEK
jgi:hypothetical protein